MNRDSRYWLCLVIVGVAIELVGLGLAVFVHSLDPDFGPSVRVLSPVNVGQFLIVLGLGLKVIGMAYGFVSPGLGNLRGPSLLAGPTLAGLAPLFLIVAFVAVAPATESVSRRHADVESVIPPNATLESLKQIVRESGTEQALDRLEELVATDDNTAVQSHFFAHEIGRFSVTYYADAPEAFSRCRAVFESGCYHGVLEGHFQNRPDVGAKDMASLCNAVVGTGQSRFVEFQCLHGLGHGLTLYFDHEIFKALEYCDYLPADWHRSSCYSGVFMENIVYEGWSYLSDYDPLYPCNSVQEKYQDACYIMQTSAILKFNGYDFAAAFGTCHTAPEKFVSTCYESMGRDISGYTLQDPETSLQLCQLGAADYRSHCFAAVARQLANADGRTQSAFFFCRMVPRASKAACYAAIGRMVDALYLDETRQEAECAQSEREYVDACLAGDRF